MRDFRALDVPYQVEGIGGKILKGVAKGTVHGTVVDDGGSLYTLFLFQG